MRAQPTLDSFAGQLEADLTSEPSAPEEPPPAPPQDDTPPTFTTLDQVLIRSVIASVAEVHGALTPDKVEDLVEEVVQLNLERHQSYFHRGFLAVLLGRPLELDFPEASDVRRGIMMGIPQRTQIPAALGSFFAMSGLLCFLSPWIALAPVMGLAGIAMAIRGLRAGHEVSTLLWSKLAITGIISSVGLTMFPFILPSTVDPHSSLTVWDSSSSHLTLFVMLVMAVIFMPLILAYTAWVYNVLWGKVTEADVTENSHSVY